ncbi:Uncharacterised protein [Mycobacteroides abscessus subsp. abscessus]|uniref:hypothetical protein n=1 Tax=Mycobacteroides abscessus TaxID=36809 RepID=UPI00092B9429|nr:hypothetical protein [Mycobacteroides abscessus]SHU29028.1 Uncharacterised protein [Mycobacteroides abscessus subsp. abscessus]
MNNTTDTDPVPADDQSNPTWAPTATICGSMRLFEPMLTIADELTRLGFLVLMPFVRKNHNQPIITRRIEGLERRYGRAYARDAVHLNATPITGTQLDLLHRTKIDRADQVVIVTDHHGYIGESTTAEISYSRHHGKPITYARVDRADYRDSITWLHATATGLSPRAGAETGLQYANRCTS